MRQTSWGRPLLVLLGYILAAGAFTWPLALHLTTTIPGDGKDGWQETWDLWWFATALGAGRNPFHTDLLFHPFGADLYFHSLMPFNGLISLPAQLAGGPVVAYNFAILFSLTMSAWGMYWLARDRLARAGATVPGWRGELPPVAAGLLFGFSPYMADHLLSHLNLVAAEGLPFAVLALLRAGESRGPGAGGWGLGVGGREPGSREQGAGSRGSGALPWRWIIAAALALVVTGLCDWQYVLFLALWTALWLAVSGIRYVWSRRQSSTTPHPPPPTPRGPALAWAIFLLLVSPLAAGMVAQLGRTAGSTLGGLAQETIIYSADLLAYVIPSPFHPWWGPAAAEALRPLAGTLIEKVMFPTYTALALAATGWAAARRRGWPVGLWTATAGAFFVLSLGPYLHIGGQRLPVPLPAWLLYQLPVANLTRAPGRFVVIVLLALAVLLAFGLAALLRRGAAGSEQGAGGRGQQSEPTTTQHVSRFTSHVSRLTFHVALLAVLLLGLELWAAPYRLARWDVPGATGTLATLPPETAVFDVPVRPFESAYMQAQMVHRRPLIGGYLARAPAYPLLDGVPVFTALRTLANAPALCAPPLDGAGPAMFTYFTTGALVLHKDRMDNRELNAARALAAQAGLGAPALEDERLVIYRPPLTATVAPWVNLELSAWYPLETTADGGLLHWMGAAGTLHVWRPAAAAARLALRAYSFQAPRRVAVLVDGQLHAEVRVDPAPGPLLVDLPPAAGHTTITLRALDPPISPAQVGLNDDPRRLSLALVSCDLHIER
jgi:hypothetical protein